MKIRLAKSEDSDAIGQVHVRSWQAAYRGQILPHQVPSPTALGEGWAMVGLDASSAPNRGWGASVLCE